MTSARAKSCASNGRRSSSCSPTPISFTEAELVRDRDRDAAFRGAVELRQHDAGDAGGLAEELRLLHAVLAGRRVDDEQRLVRRTASLPSITRRTFASSSIRFACVCSRPAVSTITTSRPRACAASIAS